MEEPDFHNLADDVIEAIQNHIDESGEDIDYDEVGGVLTLEFENGSKIIFSKQAPVKQLWMAAQSGGFHFNFDETKQQWICDSGDRESLQDMLTRLTAEQGGINLSFDNL